MVESIPVSAVVACHACPRRYYFERSAQREESPRYTVCKQIGLHLGTPLDADGIWQEVITVLPGADAELREFFDASLAACRRSRWKVPVESEVMVASERLGMHGRVDKIFDDGISFAVVRSSPAPRAGVYSSDRVRIACYAQCLAEMTGRDVAGGYIEYVPSGVSRHVEPQPRDRREMLRGLSAARKVADGEVPRKPFGAPCEGCTYADRCRTGSGRRLSDLF
jgi:CRISPR-associated exonuclease Cas4